MEVVSNKPMEIAMELGIWICACALPPPTKRQKDRQTEYLYPRPPLDCMRTPDFLQPVAVVLGQWCAHNAVLVVTVMTVARYPGR